MISLRVGATIAAQTKLFIKHISFVLAVSPLEQGDHPTFLPFLLIESDFAAPSLGVADIVQVPSVCDHELKVFVVVDR